MKLPEIPGRMKAQTATEPARNINNRLEELNSCIGKLHKNMTSKKAKEKPIMNPFLNWSGINGFVKSDNNNIPEKKDLRKEGKF